MGKMLDRREQRVRALVTLGHARFSDGLSVEQVEESLRRYILVHYGGSRYTVDGMVVEAMAKLEYNREKEKLAALT